VMNLVSVLIAPAVVALSIGPSANPAIRIPIAAVALLGIVVAVYVSKRRSTAIADSNTDAPEPASV
jgi:K(+)-stimulated pyrophosphate-energized sodium pump